MQIYVYTLIVLYSVAIHELIWRNLLSKFYFFHVLQEKWHLDNYSLVHLHDKGLAKYS